MEYLEIKTDENRRELVSHGNETYPMKLYLNKTAEYVRSTIEWHWHDEFELFYVAEGELGIYIGNERIRLSAGNGIFINSKVIHRFQSEDNAIMPNILFSPRFIAPKNSLIYEKYVNPILHSDFSFLLLSPEIPWQAEIMDNIRLIFEQQKNELKLHHFIEAIWLTLTENLDYQPLGKEDVYKQRARMMMSYIANHYPDRVTLKEIASAANISKSEALRCFKKCLDTTPMNYLMDYRLNKSAELLHSDTQNITQIALSCGFESTGYFGKMFRRKYHATPTEYRTAGSISP